MPAYSFKTKSSESSSFPQCRPWIQDCQRECLSLKQTQVRNFLHFQGVLIFASRLSPFITSSSNENEESLLLPLSEIMERN